MKGFKAQFKEDMAQAFVQAITDLLAFNVVEDDDKLVYAALMQVRLRLQKKLLNYQVTYTITFTPVEALAIRIMYTDFVQPSSTQFSNRLRQLADEVHKQYAA